MMNNSNYTLQCLLIFSTLILSLNTYSQEVNKDNFLQYHQVADSLNRSFRPDSALHIYTQLVSFYEKNGKDSSYLEAKSSLMRTLIFTFKFEKAEEFAREFILELEKDYPDKRSFLGDAYKTLGTVNESFSNNPEKALQYYRKAISFIKGLPENEDMLSTLFTDLGTTLFQLGEIDSTIYYLEKSIETKWMGAIPDTANIAWKYRQLALVSDIVGQRSESIKYGWKGLSLLNPNNPGHLRSRADLYIVLGNTYRVIGELDSSFFYLNEGQKIGLQIYPPGDNRLAIGYENIGTAANAMSRFNSAETALKKGLDIALKNLDEDPLLPVFIYNSLGNIYSKRYGISDEAIAYFNQALIMLGDADDLFAKKQRSLVLSNLGVAYSSKAKFNKSFSNDSLSSIQYRKALNYINQAITDLKATPDYTKSELANKYNILASTYKDLSLFNESEKYYKKSLETLKELDFIANDLIGMAYEGMSILYLRTNQQALSEKYISAAEKAYIQFSGKQSANLVSLHTQLAQSYFLLNELDQAREQLHKAHEANKLKTPSGSLTSEDLISPINYLNYLMYSAAITAKEAEIKKDPILLKTALDEYKLFAGSIAQFVSSHGNQKDLLSHLGTFNYGFVDYATVCFKLYQEYNDQEYLEEALRASQMNRAVLLQNVLNKKKQQDFSQIPDEILKKEGELEDRITYLTSQLFANVANSTDSLQRINIESDLFAAKQLKLEFQKELSEEFQNYFSLKYEIPETNLTEIQYSLKEDQSIIQYLMSEDYMLVYIITKNNLIVEKVELPSNFLEMTFQFNHNLKSPGKNDFIPHSVQLYQVLIKPFEKHLTGDRVIIVPDADLWNINFDLLITDLPDKQQSNPDYLLKHYSFSYLYSSGLLGAPQIQANTKPGVAAFAYGQDNHLSSNVSSMRRNLIELPGSILEVSDLADKYDGKFFFAEESNESNFKNFASQYSVLHLALHGQIDELDHNNSKLYFKGESKDSTQDNLLYPFELYNMNIGADLVVLSACNSGSGRITRGEGIMSLGRAFQYAGVNSLLLSKWEVSDAIAPEIIVEFYENLNNGMPKDIALRQAKLEFLTNADDITRAPYYWGNFFILGDTSPIELQAGMDYKLWLLGLLVVIIIVVLVKRRRA